MAGRQGFRPAGLKIRFGCDSESWQRGTPLEALLDGEMLAHCAEDVLEGNEELLGVRRGEALTTEPFYAHALVVNRLRGNHNVPTRRLDFFWSRSHA